MTEASIHMLHEQKLCSRTIASKLSKLCRYAVCYHFSTKRQGGKACSTLFRARSFGTLSVLKWSPAVVASKVLFLLNPPAAFFVIAETVVMKAYSGENGVVHPRLLNYPTNNLNLRYLLVFISFFRNTKKNCVLVQHDTKVTSATNEMAIRTRC
jgi:hypothetical protein